MPLHHIIPKHEWGVRFGNLRGFNAPDNMIDLSTAQHAQVHLHYFNEITHLEYDRIAGMAISGEIGKEEINKATRLFWKGKKRPAFSETHKKKLSEATKVFLSENAHPLLGCQVSQKTKDKISKSLYGRFQGIESPHYNRPKEKSQKAKQSAIMTGRYAGSKNPMFGRKRKGEKQILRAVVTCPHCKKSGRPCNMKRWHFENCKGKFS